MIKVFDAQDKMKRIYRQPQKSIYTHRFLEDLSSGYSFVLGERSEKRDFFAFDPEDCYAANLLRGKHYNDLSYEIERLIDAVTYSLLTFDRAYVILKPQYANDQDINSGTKTISEIKLYEIKGFPDRCVNSNIKFIYSINNNVKEMDIQRDQLIEFDIKELGFKNKYFRNILKKLEKCDITLADSSLISNDVSGYDYLVHSNECKLKELKALKGVGWIFGNQGLSDSYILYKKIQGDKLKLKLLDYILDKLNCGLESFLGNPGGKLVARKKTLDYDQLWREYSDGKVTGTELTSILYDI